MIKSKGSLFVLQIETSPGIWENIPGERVSGFTTGNESVDTTSKQQTSRELSACGLKTISITASGIVKDDLTKTLFNTLCDASFNNSIRSFRVMSGLEIIVKGLFLVTSFGRNGEYNNAEQWSLSLESAGEVVTGFDIPVPPIVPYASSYVLSVRKIVDGYVGHCIRVRRSLDNGEQNIPFLDGWLDESALLAFVGTGDGFVVAWYNQTPQYGVTSFTNPNALTQPKIVNGGVIYRASGCLHPYVRFDKTRGDNLQAPLGKPYLYADNLGMFMSEVSSIYWQSVNTQFWQDHQDGNRYPGISRYFTQNDGDTRRFGFVRGDDLKRAISGTRPDYPLSNFSASATIAGHATTVLGGNLERTSRIIPFTQSYARSTVIGEVNPGSGYMNMFELIGQSYAWSEGLQLALAANQSIVFQTPGPL